MKKAFVFFICGLSIAGRTAGGTAARAAGDSFSQGVEFYESGRYPQALELFQSAIDRNPNDADAHREIGNCYYRMGDRKRAVHAYETSLKLREDPLLRKWLAALQAGKGDAARPLRPESRWGLKLGFGAFAGVVSEETDSEFSSVFFSPGAFYARSLSELFGLQGELNYLSAREYEEINLSHIQLVLTVRFFTRKGDYSSFFLGPFFNFTVSEDPHRFVWFVNGNELFVFADVESKPLEVGLTAGREWVLFRNFLLGFKMDFGMSNPLSPKPGSNVTIDRSTSYLMNIGFQF